MFAADRASDSPAEEEEGVTEGECPDTDQGGKYTQVVLEQMALRLVP